MEIRFSNQPLLVQKSDATLIFLEQNFNFNDTLQQLSKKFFPALEQYMKESEFIAKPGQFLFVPCSDDKKVHALLFMGLGKVDAGKKVHMEVYRRALGQAIKTIQAKKLKNVTVALPQASLFGTDVEYVIEQTAIICHMASYFFDEYMTDPSRKALHDILITLQDEHVEENLAQKALQRGTITALAVNQARHWIDMPPSATTPSYLANKAEEIAKKHHLGIKVFSEEDINKLGMGGIAGVSAGSDQDAKLIILEYKTSNPNAQTLAFVGKGITFDSGGLSLKPASSMETMKEDMSGAACVISCMDALAQLKPHVNIIAVAPVCENMPSGKATKPGDIIRFYNKKTAEVKNTDAEGRLILADALSYTVEHYKPDAMIDLATLTGACAYALGPFFSGLMSQHDELSKKVQDAADISGDRVWPLPFHNDYKAAIKSSVAGICNIGSNKYKAGAITAGFFLQNFVENTPWVHLDIAGTAFDVPDISYYSTGATGAGVRLLIELAMKWK